MPRTGSSNPTHSGTIAGSKSSIFFPGLLKSLHGTIMVSPLFMHHSSGTHDHTIGESHYIGDLSEGYIPPEMQYFVNGIPHTAWQAVLPYYISAYKAGRRDVTIPTEGAVFWYRNTPKFTCSNGGTNCGSNSGIPATDCVEDAVFVLTLSNSATTVNVLIGGSGQTFNVAKGAKLVKMPFNGRTGQVQVSIKGKTGTGPAPITNNCPAAGKVNFNPLVGKAM